VTRVLVVEDDTGIADFIKRGLTLNGFDVDVAHTARAGLEAAISRAPDVVVLDLMLPDGDGIDLCRELRASGDFAIVILTARAAVGERVRGLEAGADDYLPKPFAFDELLARIKAVLRRSARLGSTIRVADLEIDVDNRLARRGSRVIELTTREFDLLALLAKHARKPLRREFILRQVWGYDFGGETDPVKVYVNFLRRKLNAEGEPDVIHTLRDYGYVLRERP
jgi:DNA-binding response OmpR family regulator